MEDDDVSIQFSDGDMSINIGSDDEDEIHIKKPKKHMKVKTKSILKPPRQLPNFNDKTFEMFSNPSKRMPERNNEQNGFSDNEEQGSEENMENSISEEGSVDYGNEYNEDVVQPSDGFETIEDEKQDLLYKFYRLENKGIRVCKSNFFN